MLLLPHDADRMLGDFLRDNDVVPSAAFDMSEAEPGEGIVSHLLNKGAVDEAEIAKRFAHVFGFDTVQLDAEAIHQRPLKDKIPPAFITRNRVLPFKLDDTYLHVAIADPKGLRYVNELKLMTGYHIRTHVTELSAFDQFILAENDPNPEMHALRQQALTAGELDPADLLTPEQAEEQGVNLAELTADQADIKQAACASADVNLDALNDQEDKEKAKLTIAASGSDVIDFVNQVLVDAIVAGVSDIHIETFRERARIRFRKDGVLQLMDEFDEFLMMNYAAVVTRIKILSKLDIAERRLPQDGAITTDLAEKTVDIRVSVLPAAHGERVVMRILDPESANFELDELGLEAESLAAVRKASHSPQGMILVTGPTGSGKSTTLYGILKELNQPGTNILTAEDPVEYDLEGIGQVQVRDDIGLGFAEALRSFLRQDPEVIMVGEIRDKETSDIAVKASLTGHLVLSTLHTNDAPSTITRLINMGVPDYLITSALSLVIAQRLARKICPSCKTHDEEITQEELISLGFSKSEAKLVQPAKGAGCDACMHTGVKGRRAVHEVLVVTPNIKQAVLKGANDMEIKTIAKEEGFRTMQATARELIKEGVISVEEYKRILVMD